MAEVIATRIFFAKNMNFKNKTELKFNNDDLYALEHGNRHQSLESIKDYIFGGMLA